MNEETVLILRTCNADMTSYGGFRWPESGPVVAPDWAPTMKCGNGLHGLLWGEGSVQSMNLADDAKWLVFRAAVADLKHGEGDLTDKCKARAGYVEYCGTRDGAITYLLANGAKGKRVVFGTSTSGYHGTSTSGNGGTSTSGDDGTSTSGDRGTSTSGDDGTSTSGDHGTSTSGDHGTSTSGDGGTSTSGNGGTSTSGNGGTICILRWNGKRYKPVIATVKDEDGDGQLEPNTPYRLDDTGRFVAVPKDPQAEVKP